MSPLRELTRGFDRRRIALTCGVAVAVAALLCVPGMSLAPFPNFLIASAMFSVAIALALTVTGNLRQSLLPPAALNTMAVLCASAVVTLALSALQGQDLLRELESSAGRQGIGSVVTLGLVIGAAMSFVMVLRERQQADQARHEARERLLEKQALESKLKLLQAQVEPHFLFNTLASVQRLVATDPAAANTMLEDLNQYLRACLPDMRESQSTVGRELRMVRAYLGIMQVRMGQRLSWRIDVAPSLHDQPFPPMMLLSLVENAIKHGLRDSTDGVVAVQATTTANRLQLRVRDNGTGFDPRAPAGVGLGNIRQRLSALYGQAATLSLEENAAGAGGVTATIQIPYAHS
jgi:signal transduction histidine kinase